MADEGTFATTSEVQYKAGANASATSKAEGYVNVYIKQAESRINTYTRYNWHDAYSSLNEDVKHLLKEAASNLAAIYVILYDPSGFNSEDEVIIILNGLYEMAMECITLLKDKKVETFVTGA